MSGRYDKDVFRKRYAFLYDEALPSEREGLKKALRRAKDAGSKRELQAQLTRVEQQIQDEKVIAPCLFGRRGVCSSAAARLRSATSACIGLICWHCWHLRMRCAVLCHAVLTATQMRVCS